MKLYNSSELNQLRKDDLIQLFLDIQFRYNELEECVRNKKSSSDELWIKEKQTKKTKVKISRTVNPKINLVKLKQPKMKEPILKYKKMKEPNFKKIEVK